MAIVSNSIKGLSPAEEKALLGFKQELHERFGGVVVEMRLFGSRARGQGDEASDLDVAVVVREESGKLRRDIYDLAAEIFQQSEIRLSPFVISVDRLNWLRSIERGIALDIEREGIKL